MATGPMRFHTLGRGDVERGKVIAAIIDWLTIRHREAVKRYPDESFSMEGMIGQLEADVAHSSLLWRLLEGKKPLGDAPPRAFSYPAYELIEEPGPHRLMDVSFEAEPAKRVLIEQSWWDLGQALNVKEHELRAWSVRWPASGMTFVLWVDRAGVWWMQSLEFNGLEPPG